MINLEGDEDYVIQKDEAAVIIKPSGEIQVVMPSSDEDEDGNISSDSPTFRAMVVMAFLGDKEVRDSVERKLVAEHFSV